MIRLLPMEPALVMDRPCRFRYVRSRAQSGCDQWIQAVRSDLGRRGMRKIGVLPQGQAQVLVDYLLTREIGAELRDAAGDEVSVWIIHERDLETARQALAEFREDPQAAHFEEARVEAQKRRVEARRAEQRLQKQMRAKQGRWAARGEDTCTLILILLCVVVTIATDLGNVQSPLMPKLGMVTAIPSSTPGWVSVTPFPQEILGGQVWRLVTPVFVHLGWVHLVFNMLALFHFGTMIERRRGIRYYLLLALALAIFSNACQGWLGSPRAFGMSGVIYGLFGYVWMRMKYQALEGYFVHPTTIFMLMIWFVICFMGVTPMRVANVAHASGLGLGLAIGAGPFLWRRFQTRKQRKLLE